MTVLYDEFRSLIRDGRQETPLQKFLEANPSILKRAFNGGSYFPTVFPKFSLAGEFIPDFVMIGHRSSWVWTVDLIEIEPSVLDKPLFNKKDQPTGRLRDAENQIFKWQTWMEINRDTFFVSKALNLLKERGAWDAEPKFYQLSEGTHQWMHIRYRIVIGRRELFGRWGNTYRSQKYDQQHIEIVPWDRLLETLGQPNALPANSLPDIRARAN